MLTAVLYGALFAVALAVLLRSAGAEHQTRRDIPAWRHLSLAPMLVVILGSFVSLPVLLLVAAAAKVGSF